MSIGHVSMVVKSEFQIFVFNSTGRMECMLYVNALRTCR